MIIVGGGLVGAGLAAALCDFPLRIALIDARMPSNDDPRLFALNLGSCRFLQNLGLWPVLSNHASRIDQVHVSFQGHFGAVRLNCEEVRLPSLGYVIPARFVELALNEKLIAQQENPHIYRPATLKSLTQKNGCATLVVETASEEKILQSNIVIGADGTESTVREQLNIPVEVVDYQQSALVMRTTLQRSHHHIAYERFKANGAIAMLPLVGNECATIWTDDCSTLSQLKALSDEELLRALQKEFGYRLGRLQQISQRSVFPLRMVRAEKTFDQCVFLLGNSAHTLHPIAAQGFNLALYEVARLVAKIEEKQSQQNSFTSLDLQEISELVQPQQALSIGVSHRLANLFKSHSPILHSFLQLGMIGMDILTPIKKMFMEKIILT